MRLRTFALLALLVFLPAAPAQEKAKAPTLGLRLKGLDDFLADARFVAAQAGRDEEFKQAERLLQRMAGEKGLEGLDTKKPMGLYAYLGPKGVDSTAVLMLPIADQPT